MYQVILTPEEVQSVKQYVSQDLQQLLAEEIELEEDTILKFKQALVGRSPLFIKFANAEKTLDN